MVVLAGTGLDTRRAEDHNSIIDLLGWSTTLTSAQLSQFRNDLEAQAQQGGLTAFETRILRDARVSEARMLDVEYVRGKAATERGVWAAGRVIHKPDHETTFATQAFRAGKGEGTYAFHGNQVSKAELEASAYDCEVPVLDQLSEYVTARIKELVGPVIIQMSGSMGPCEGCQGRIRQFILDMNAVACNVKVHLPLIVEVKYTTPLQGRDSPRLPRRTQYGYTEAKEVAIPNSTAKKYWVKTFVTTLGKASPPTVTENPG